MPDKSIDHTITDPPYSHHVHSNQARFTESNRASNGGNTYVYDLGFACLTAESRVEYAFQISRLTKRWILVFCDVESVGDWKRAFEYVGALHKRTCAWIKPAAQPQLSGDRPAQGFEPIVCAYGSLGRSHWNAGGKVGIYYSAIPRTDRIHPTEKPIDLMEQLVRDFTNPGDLILDPFSGGGSTHVAAKKWSRRSIGFEIDPSYVSLANERTQRTECVLDDPSSLIQKVHARQMLMAI